MFHANSTDALRAALRSIGRDVDPDALKAKALERGIELPIVSFSGFAPGLGRNQGRIVFDVREADHAKLREIVDQLIGRVAA